MPIGNEANLLDDVGKSFGIEDAPANNGGDQGQDTQGGAQPATNTQQDVQPFTDDEGGAQPAARGQQPAQQQDNRQPTLGPDGKPLPKHLDPVFNNKPQRDERGRLLDKDGKVIAVSANERRLAHNLNRAQHAANRFNQENTQLRQRVAQYAHIDALSKQANLQLNDVTEAINFRAMFNRDAVGATREIVARVLATGVTMEQLFGKDAGPDINARLITGELDRRLAPLTAKVQREEATERVEQQARQDFDAFIASHPHADVHGHAIANLINDNEGMSPTQAYYELRLFAEKQGLDFTQDLKAQLDAQHSEYQQGLEQRNQQRGNPPNNQQRQPQQQQRRDTRMPGGHRNASGGDVNAQPREAMNGRSFDARTGWKDIAASVVADLQPYGGRN